MSNVSTTSFHNSTNLQDCQNILILQIHKGEIIPYHGIIPEAESYHTMESYQRQYFTVPHLFLQESGHSSGIHRNFTGIPLWNKNGIKQAKVEILIYLSQLLKLHRYIHFSLSLPFLHKVHSCTLPLKFNFK